MTEHFEIKRLGKYKTRDDRMAVALEKTPDGTDWYGVVRNANGIWRFGLWKDCGLAYRDGIPAQEKITDQDIISPWEEGVTFQEAVAAFDAGAAVTLDGLPLDIVQDQWRLGHGVLPSCLRFVTADDTRSNKWIIEHPEPDYKALLKEALPFIKQMYQYWPKAGYSAEGVDDPVNTFLNGHTIKALLAEDTDA